jgi:mannose-1-phosphate guanylyltransferase
MTRSLEPLVAAGEGVAAWRLVWRMQEDSAHLVELPEGKSLARSMASGRSSGLRPWAIVLAAGDGTRLESLTLLDNTPVPKQFCSLGAEPSMLALSLARAERVAAPDRVVPVVAAAHRSWWEAELRGLPDDNVVVQPANKGTGAGILLPLLRVVAKDPEACVVVLPSDHWIDDHEIFEDAVAEALSRVAAVPGRPLLLAMTPDAPDPGLGWIVAAAGPDRVKRVTCFREKPSPDEAEELLARGALVNSFVFAARASDLLRLFETWLPAITASFAAHDPERDPSLEALYARLPSSDFSRDVLQPGAAELDVLPVPPCGWSDLGTPERVARCLARRARITGRASTPLVDLARRLDNARRRGGRALDGLAGRAP